MFYGVFKLTLFVEVINVELSIYNNFSRFFWIENNIALN